MSQSAATFTSHLIRAALASPTIHAAFAGGPLAEGSDVLYGELDLYLVVEDEFRDMVYDWLGSFGELALCDRQGQQVRAITADGVGFNLTLCRGVTEVPPGPKQLFNRTGAERQENTGFPDLNRAAGRFWDAIYRAAAAIGRGEPYSAHGALEEARSGLVNLYRIALKPTAPGEGWGGVEGLAGTRALAGLTPWLVCPLETRAQWRCAYKLAQSYESLLLPLTEKLGLAYPWKLRNLVFERLDEIKPDRHQVPVEIPQAPEPTSAKGGAAKFKVKRAKR